jgi:hypothetical protein
MAICVIIESDNLVIYSDEAGTLGTSAIETGVSYSLEDLDTDEREERKTEIEELVNGKIANHPDESEKGIVNKFDDDWVQEVMDILHPGASASPSP